MVVHPKRVALSEEQVLCFRARRGHLAGPGAVDGVQAAADLIGAQAQQLGPALWALAMRTRGCPTAVQVRQTLLQEPRRLVRTWGQRDTLHLYAADQDWTRVIAARPQWSAGGRRGAEPNEKELAAACQRMHALKRCVTRKDLRTIPGARLLREADAKLRPGEAPDKAAPGEAARLFAASRLLWLLAGRGEVCMAGKKGAEQEYATRKMWHPNLDWPRRLPAAVRAATDLARRYLALYGPATAQDMAHFFGAKVSTARAWLTALKGEPGLIPVACGARPGLVALCQDRDLLAEPPPKGTRAWPLRLLPLWDTMLMGHADKSWSVPQAAERKLIWKPGAYVRPVVLARGRAVGLWSHKLKARRVEIEVEPLSGWHRPHAAGVRREARAFAAHLGVAEAVVRIED